MLLKFRTDHCKESLEAAWTRTSNFARRAAGISPAAPPPPPLRSRATPPPPPGEPGDGGRARGGGAERGSSRPRHPGRREGGRGEGSEAGAESGGAAQALPGAPRRPRPQRCRAAFNTSQYIPSRIVNTSCLISIHPIHPSLQLQYSRQYILQFFNTCQYISQYITCQ